MGYCPFCGSSKIKEPGFLSVDWGMIALKGIINGGLEALMEGSDAVIKESKKDRCSCKDCFESWNRSHIALYEEIFRVRFNFRLQEHRQFFKLLDERQKIVREIELLKEQSINNRTTGEVWGCLLGIIGTIFGGLIFAGVYPGLFLSMPFVFILIFLSLPIWFSIFGSSIGYLIDLVFNRYHKLGDSIKRKTEKKEKIEEKIKSKFKKL